MLIKLKRTAANNVPNTIREERIYFIPPSSNKKFILLTPGKSGFPNKLKKKNKKMIAPSAKKAKIAPKRTLKTFSNPLPAEVTTGLASLYISPTFAVDSLANFTILLDSSFKLSKFKGLPFILRKSAAVSAFGRIIQKTIYKKIIRLVEIPAVNNPKNATPNQITLIQVTSIPK